VINRLLNYLQRFLSGDPPIVTRLSADEAIALARAGLAHNDNLNMASAHVRDGQTVWFVSEAAIGSVQVVEVDDATGAVLAKYRRGIR
jgi:hypothetical protein